MRHYEIVFLVDSNRSEQVPEMIERYRSTVESNKGKVHRLEDWGIRQLAYPIDKITKAHYVLINIECESSVCEEISYSFQFNDAIIRHLVLRLDQPVSEASPIAIAMAKEKDTMDKKTEKNKAGDTDTSTSEKAAQTAAAQSGQVTDKVEDGNQSQQSKLSE